MLPKEEFCISSSVGGYDFFKFVYEKHKHLLPYLDVHDWASSNGYKPEVPYHWKFHGKIPQKAFNLLYKDLRIVENKGVLFKIKSIDLLFQEFKQKNI